MSLPGMSDDGTTPVKRSSEYDCIAKDIVGPKRVRRGGGNRLYAVLLQIVFGYVGAGYVYLGDKKKAFLSTAVFVAGALLVVGLEMLIFPTETVVNYSLMPLQYAAYAIFLAVSILYFLSIYDCNRVALRLTNAGGDSLMTRKPTKEERMERIFGEHDTRMAGSNDSR
ncbi:MAG: hypothetical protein V1875_01925 [Candidatus Altiarchaeota archaeon]